MIIILSVHPATKKILERNGYKVVSEIRYADFQFAGATFFQNIPANNTTAYYMIKIFDHL